MPSPMPISKRRPRATPTPRRSWMRSGSGQHAFVEPEPKEIISIRLDRDVRRFFRAGGRRRCRARLNDVRRAFVEARKDRERR